MPMMRLLPWSAAAAAACSVAFLVSSAGAQTNQANCGERWSQADMRYVGVPCTSQTTKSADGKESCGAERWSQADMRYVGVSCTSQATKTADGKDACGGERWSQ